MNDNDKSSRARPPRPPVWNKGKLIGPKPRSGVFVVTEAGLSCRCRTLPGQDGYQKKSVRYRIDILGPFPNPKQSIFWFWFACRGWAPLHKSQR
jgi:hypothetical protein